MGIMFGFCYVSFLCSGNLSKEQSDLVKNVYGDISIAFVQQLPKVHYEA